METALGENWPRSRLWNSCGREGGGTVEGNGHHSVPGANAYERVREIQARIGDATRVGKLADHAPTLAIGCVPLISGIDLVEVS